MPMPVPGTRGKAAFRAYGAWGWTARTSEDTVIFKVRAGSMSRLGRGRCLAGCFSRPLRSVRDLPARY